MSIPVVHVVYCTNNIGISVHTLMLIQERLSTHPSVSKSTATLNYTRIRSYD